MSENYKKLETMIQNGKFDDAMAIIKNETDHHEGENLVSTILRTKESTPELLEAALEMFLNTKKNSYQQHGFWVHSLSHFSGPLWRHRADKWIKKFYETAFKGANELGNPSCSDRLVDDFAWYANWNDDLTDFGLTPENLRCLNDIHDKHLNKKLAYAKSRIEASPFASEEAFIRWKLNRPETLTIYDFGNVIQSLIQQLEQLGADTGEFKNLVKEVKELLTKKLSELEGQVSTETRDAWKEWLEKDISKTKKALASLN